MAKKKVEQIQEVKAKRTLEQIEQEYRELCTAQGDRQYRIEILKSEINQVNQRLLELNQEAASVKNA